MTAVIVCNGSIKDYTYMSKYMENAGFVIGVDGGAEHLRKFGIKPDALIGDFDSIKKEHLEYYGSLGVEILKFPRDKNKTDAELAIELAQERGFKDIIFIGGLGTRSDHSLSNIFMLKRLLDKGVKGKIADEQNEIVLVRDSISLIREADAKVTLLSISEKTEGVTTKGLLYPLTDATLELGSSWGVSNEFAAEVAEVTIRSGLLMVIKSKD
jgi:thiamine pyrophosphokinase